MSMPMYADDWIKLLKEFGVVKNMLKQNKNMKRAKK